ncbi:MAG: TRAP transporter small permease [Spirochaetales bacterium]|nr:TRAP transporter small permease [Spirochaetales bacterium]
MNKFLEKYRKAMDLLAKIILVITGIMLCIMVLIIFFLVITRKFFSYTPTGSEETTLMLMVYSGLLAAAVVYRERMHLGIHFFLQKMKPKPRNRMYFAIDVIIGLFSLFMIVWGTIFAWEMRNQTMSATKISVGISYLPIPLAGLFFILFVIEKIFTDFSERKTGSVEKTLPEPEV